MREESRKVVEVVVNYFAEKVEELLKKDGKEIKFDIVYNNGKNGTEWDIEENGHLPALAAFDENDNYIASIFIIVDGRCNWGDYQKDGLQVENTTLSKEILRGMGKSFDETYDWKCKFDKVIAKVIKGVVKIEN